MLYGSKEVQLWHPTGFVVPRKKNSKCDARIHYFRFAQIRGLKYCIYVYVYIFIYISVSRVKGLSPAPTFSCPDVVRKLTGIDRYICKVPQLNDLHVFAC